MGLRDLIIPTKQMPVAGGSLTLRGLSITDLMHLLRESANEMSVAFDDIQGHLQAMKGKSLGDQDTIAIIRKVAEQAPTLIGRVIALSSDEPDLYQTAARLTFADQIKILTEIFYLTFTSEEEVKKLVEIVVRAVTGVNSLQVVDVAVLSAH